MKTMKPVIYCLLAIAIFGLAGCGGVSKAEHDAVLGEKTALEAKVSALMKETADLKAMNEKLARDKGDLTVRLNELTQDRATYKEKLEALQKEIDTIKGIASNTAATITNAVTTE